MSTSNRPAPLWGRSTLALLIFLSLGNTFVLLFVTPKFGQIYSDALPGKSLPLATTMLVHHQILIALLNLLIVLVCIIWHLMHGRRSILLTNLGSLCNVLQMGATIIALFVPMVGITTGMSDSAAENISPYHLTDRA